MERSRLQIAVWLLTPLIGLFLLMLVIGARGGIFIFPAILLLVLMFIVPVWWNHSRGRA